MKNIYIIFILFLSIVFAQISMTDIDKISNQQLDKIKEELQSDNSLKTPLDKSNSDSIKLKEVKIQPNIISSAIDSKFFGYNYFQTEVNFFDNIPPPSDFKLGSGDEITLSLWGETNSREKFIISKEGLIYYKNIGFINLSNKTVQEAEILLINELSKIYSTLKDDKNSTKLMIELGKLKSLNIFFSGEIVKPGIHLIHPFSDIFTSLVQSGGVNKDGSLRNIQLIRNGNIIDTVDFYTFFNKGSSSSFNTRLIDGDTIHVPPVKNRIEIKGAVVRPGFYEILPNEKVTDAISYAAGLKARALSTITIDTVIPVISRSSDDNAMSSMNINLKDADKISLNNGDIINIREMASVASKVEIFGRVKSPGFYSAINMSLKDILDIAGGFDDPNYRKTIKNKITILRQDENQFYSNEIIVYYKNADQFKLEINDKIFVYEDINYKNNFTYRVEGEVYKPGTYAIGASTTTVREALSLAGGLTDLSSVRNLTVKQELTELDDEGNQVTTSEAINNVTLDFEIGINSVIIASPLENVVRVEGNVYNPGLITFTKGYRYPRYIELAGGYKQDALKNKTYIKRANGNIEKVNGYFLSRRKNIYPGDTIIVPANPDPSDFDITALISDLSTTLANIAAILLIVDNQTD